MRFMKYDFNIQGGARRSTKIAPFPRNSPRSRDFQIPEQHNYQESGTSKLDFVDKKKRNGGPELGELKQREGAALRSQPRNRPQDPHLPVPTRGPAKKHHGIATRNETGNWN
jgi:hypothetical protein